MAETFAIEFRQGIEAHIELICGFPVKFEINDNGEHELRAVQGGALLFKGLGHGLCNAYCEYIGENEPYFMNDEYFEKVIKKVEEGDDGR